MKQTRFSKISGFLAGTCAGFLFGALVMTNSACGSAQQTVKTVKASVKLAEDACVFIKEVAPDNKEGQEICARESELAPYVKLILGARARQHRDAAAADVGGDK